MLDKKLKSSISDRKVVFQKKKKKKKHPEENMATVIQASSGPNAKEATHHRNNAGRFRVLLKSVKSEIV